MSGPPRQRATAPRRRAAGTGLAVAALLALVATPALAHRLLVFASAEGADIRGTAYFAGGLPAKGVRLLVQGADGALLAELQPDADGAFSYRARAPVEHRIVAEGADGHRAGWTISADELAGAFSVGAGAAGPPPGASPGPSPSPSPDASPDGSATAAAPVPPAAGTAAPDGALSPATLAAIEAAVARQVRPLREELAAADARVRLRDVLGGLGYIVGLTGLALWWRRRR